MNLCFTGANYPKGLTQHRYIHLVTQWYLHAHKERLESKLASNSDFEKCAQKVLEFACVRNKLVSHIRCIRNGSVLSFSVYTDYRKIYLPSSTVVAER